MANFLKGLGRTLGTAAGTAGAAIGGFQQDQEQATRRAAMAAEEQRAAEDSRVRNALLTKQTAQVGLPQPKGTLIVPRGARAVNEDTGKVVAEGLPPEPQTELVTTAGGKLKVYNKDTQTFTPTAETKDVPVDPFARMAETYRQEHDTRDAENWQRIYTGLMEPKRDKYGDTIEGTGLSPKDASEKADAAMGGHPRLAPKVSARP
jgi:hypothetical protein